MIRVYAALVVFVCLLAGTATAQEPRVDRTVVLDISIIEITAARAEDIEAMVKDKQRLNSLINEGKAKAVASLQMRARSGESASARVGHRVPVQTATLPGLTRARSDSNEPGTSGVGVAVPQIQYENIGLSATATPRIVAGEMVEVRLHIEQSAIERSTGTFTPTFIQRTLQDISRVRAGEPVLLFGVVQHQPPPSSPSSQPARQAEPSVSSFGVVLTARIID
ncbi:MAG TPA: hypothetical protein VKA70_07090 [Blastocatellia bacterium]|nr:hypothetical protein [Blastocatellia bacterium]